MGIKTISEQNAERDRDFLVLFSFILGFGLGLAIPSLLYISRFVWLLLTFHV
jgi:hypothetical protein